MTPEEAAAFLNRFTLGYPFKAWGGEIRATAQGGLLAVDILFRQAPHRDTGVASGGIAQRSWLEGAFFLAEPKAAQDRLARWLEVQLKHAVMHELDESLLFDGKRVFDPHTKDTP